MDPPRRLAFINGHLEIIKLLLQHGATAISEYDLNLLGKHFRE